MHSEILKPVVALVAWTLVVMFWMLVTRLPAMKKAGVDLDKLVGSTGKDADGILPKNVQWKAHNYNHLHEQPTLFYAVAIVLALSGAGNGFNVTLAWAYVGLRVLHSIVQATFNRVQIRFVLFGLASLVLVALTLHAAMAVWKVHDPAPIETVAKVYGPLAE